MLSVKNIFADTMHLFYPHICAGCGSDLISKDNLLCITCISDLPHTHFELHENNPIEKIFTGRMPVRAAHSEFYFSKGQLVQHLIHLLKYKGNKAIGHYMGELLGNSILQGGRFSNIDFLVPLPLYADKELRRGYNQAEIICKGIHAATKIPIMVNNVVRKRPTETQTRKHRAERWQNVAGSFRIEHAHKLIGKNILLVDDVITTGATLEACGQFILQIPGTSVSFAALAHASK
ncbi:ComF family protein [soil metagenome]